MKRRHYWSIVGQIMQPNGKWLWLQEPIYAPGQEVSQQKIYYEQGAAEAMRTIKKELESYGFVTKMGKKPNGEVPNKYIYAAMLQHNIIGNDYAEVDDIAICIQAWWNGKPAAIYYCIVCYNSDY